MKLIFTDYLASLKEREELDAIIPDLLSELGMNVISRPAIGTRQHGVDVAAVGALLGGERSLYLFSIKSGDLRRSGWDTGEQALRPSLNEILDTYIQNHRPRRYMNLPVVIVPCFGGDLHEDVREDVEGYIDRNTNDHDRIRFDLWNGDRIADLMLCGLLRENVLPKTWRPTFRKSVAFVDEPEISFRYFCKFLDDMANCCKSSRRARLRAIRQIHLCLWTLYGLAREAGNIEAAYLCSERAMLICWQLMKDYLAGNSRDARHLKETMGRVIELHHTISADYLSSYIQPRAKIQNGLASAIPSSSLDINLRLFDVIGRIGVHDLWQLYIFNCLKSKGKKEEADVSEKKLHETAVLLLEVIQNNRTLCTPIKDNQAIDINIACLFLSKVEMDQNIQYWIHHLVRAVIFAYHKDAAYPCIFNDYRDLVDHPRCDDPDYRIEATAGSTLVPTLAVWASLTDDTETLGWLADFVSGPYKHSTLQIWYPDSNTEEHLYHGGTDHGHSLTDIRIEREYNNMLTRIQSECEVSKAFYSLSVLEIGLWPLIVSASRHYRHPVPPHLWPLPAPDIT